MSGFFSLGGKQPAETEAPEQQEDHHHHQDTSNNSLYLFKNEEIYNKGFELWQQHYQLQQQQRVQHTHQLIQQQHHHQDHVDFSVGRRQNNIINSSSDHDSCYRSGVIGFGGNSSNTSSGGGMNCQDCGNQAKKDCSHLRCRSCCKSRGFQCPTHVKSTWVPAAKRRERLNQHQQPQPQQQPQQQLSLIRGDNSKRLRENPNPGSSSIVRLPTAASGSGLEVANFPAEVNTPAVFRCVRVSALDDEQEQYAYQTAVNIGGHVFKGMLYDQGLENRYTSGGESSSGGGGGGGVGDHQQLPLNLIASTSTAATTTTRNPVVPMFDQYPTPLTAFLAGTQFFPPPRP